MHCSFPPPPPREAAAFHHHIEFCRSNTCKVLQPVHGWSWDLNLDSQAPESMHSAAAMAASDGRAIRAAAIRGPLPTG